VEKFNFAATFFRKVENPNIDCGTLRLIKLENINRGLNHTTAWQHHNHHGEHQLEYIHIMDNRDIDHTQRRLDML